MRDRSRGTVWLLLAVLVVGPAARAGERSVSALYEPGDQAVWSFTLADKPIGRQLFRYEGPTTLAGVSAHRFRSWVIMDAAMPLPVEQRFLSELWVDEQGRPLRHVLGVEMGSNRSTVELTFEGRQAAARIVQAPAPRSLEFDLPGEVFVQANNVLGPFELLLALRPPTEHASLETLLISSNVLQVFPYEASWVKDVDTEGGTVHVYRDSLGETLSFDESGRLLTLEVPAQQLVVRRSETEVVEPFELSPASVAPQSSWDDFDVEEVTITHGEVSLAGSLTRPAGAEGRLPGVFFISGSGLQDRDGFSSGVDVGTRQVLDRLTRAGFAVLRVDDRGAGSSTGPTRGIGYQDLLADARACLDFLLAHDGVDPSCVAVIGHSEGGITAPLLAAERSQVAAIVLMASSGRPLTEVIMEQNARALDLSGITGDERDAMLTEIRHVLELVTSEGELSPEDLPEDYRAMLGMRPWLQQHARQDPVANLARVRCPVLIVQGELDFQVSAERDAPLLQAALDDAGHEDHELVVFDGLDHLFKRAPGEESRFSDYFTDRDVDEAFLARLESWLVERLARGS